MGGPSVYPPQPESVAKLAYGKNPGGGKPGGDLIFDVELIDFRQ